jgi:hypothetical protein
MRLPYQDLPKFLGVQISFALAEISILLQICARIALAEIGILLQIYARIVTICAVICQDCYNFVPGLS